LFVIALSNSAWQSFEIVSPQDYRRKEKKGKGGDDDEEEKENYNKVVKWREGRWDEDELWRAERRDCDKIVKDVKGRSCGEVIRNSLRTGEMWSKSVSISVCVSLSEVGVNVAGAAGTAEGFAVGDAVGTAEGFAVGVIEGAAVWAAAGTAEGFAVGDAEGTVDEPAQHSEQRSLKGVSPGSVAQRW
jgi:hypothetical protein